MEQNYISLGITSFFSAGVRAEGPEYALAQSGNGAEAAGASPPRRRLQQGDVLQYVS